MIDCLFIGYNHIPFSGAKKLLDLAGEDSIIYKAMNHHWIQYENQPYTAAEVFSFLYNRNKPPEAKPFEVHTNNIFSPTIAYLGSFLHKRGFTFDYINSFNHQKEELAEKLRKNEIMAIAIPTTFYMSEYPIMEIISFVKKYNETAKIIVGGAYVLNFAQNVTEQVLAAIFSKINADFYVHSPQGETALTGILSALKNNQHFENINNIIYKCGGRYITNPRQDENNKLEENPVNWDLFTESLTDVILVRASMSCPFSCGFCNFPKLGGAYQTVTPEGVQKDLEQLQKTGKVKSIFFSDDTFNFPPERFKGTLRMMIKNKYPFKWSSFIKCQFLDEETVALMAESGCESVLVGLESANQQILNNINKRTTVEQYQKGVSLLNQYGIITSCSFIIGFPGETPETVRDTFNFIEEYKPVFYQLQLWKGVPSAPIYQQREKYNLKGEWFDWSHSTMDSRTACEIIDKGLLSIKNSISDPAYDFYMTSVVELLNKGLSFQEIKNFVQAFNTAVADKLRNPGIKEVNPENWEKLNEACRVKINN